MRSTISTLLASTTILFPAAQALNTITVQSQDFIDSVTKQRFEIIGVDYQPGGSSGYDPANGIDPLSNPTACLRDAALMQQLGINTIRSYNLDPAVNHDMCASIFNDVGIYMILDVNSPLGGESINQADPASSYDTAYLNRTFQVIDAFRGYSNTLGFFSANELVNDDPTGIIDPPYIRAVTRDLKQYIAARGGRSIPVGYSAADISNNLVDQYNYVTCTTNGQTTDQTRSDFFGLNDYSWCGQSDFVTSGYSTLVQQFSGGTAPVFFSEYGCNKVLPRIFQEVPVLYGPQMTVFSGGLIYQWTQDTNNYGLIQVNDNQSANLLMDYNTLKTQYATLNLTLIMEQNTTATALKPPTCSSSLITGNSGFNSSFDIPAQPSGAAALIKNGAGGNTGMMVDVTQLMVQVPVYDTNGAMMQGLAIKPVAGANTPSGSSGSSSSSSKKSAASTLIGDTLQTVLGVWFASVAMWVFG